MSNQYQLSKFFCSVNHFKQLPAEALIEVAFLGRSNAGKSSALNVLTQQKNLARVSKTPGRTQLINYFSLPQEGHYLVDLPGYGYADVPLDIQRHWQKLLNDYLMQREKLKGAILLMDIRHPLKDSDINLLECCIYRALPVHILLTKADKLSKNEQIKQINMVKKALQNEQNISIQLFSSLKKLGLEELRAKLDIWYGY